jgi:hypothetical protein
MALTASKTNKQYDPIPSGNHVARLYQIIHIGTIKTTWQGKEQMSDKVRLTFELCNEKKAFNEGEEPRPYSISREFSFYMSSKANLRKFVEGMIGTALDEDEAATFDLEGLLGEECLLNVVHVEKDGNTYANIQGASPLPKGMTAPPLYNEKKLIDVNTATQEEIDALPDFLKDKIKSSEEYDRRFRSTATNAGDATIDPSTITPDDNPF